MQTLAMHAAAITFAAIMMISCGKESLVPITDVAESSAFLKESDPDARQSGDVKTAYHGTDGQTAKESKTPADAQYSEAESGEKARQSDDVQTTYGDQHNGHDVRSDYAKERQTHADPKLSQASFDGNARQGDVDKSGFENSDKPDSVQKTYPNSLNENTATRDWKQGEGVEKTHADTSDPSNDGSDETKETINAVKDKAQKK